MAFNYYFGMNGQFVEPIQRNNNQLNPEEYRELYPEYVNVNVNNYNYNYINTNMDIYKNDNKFNKSKNIKNKKNYEKFGYIINTQINSQPIARYFVIKSVDEDNIHKVIYF